MPAVRQSGFNRRPGRRVDSAQGFFACLEKVQRLARRQLHFSQAAFFAQFSGPKFQVRVEAGFELVLQFGILGGGVPKLVEAACHSDQLCWWDNLRFESMASRLPDNALSSAGSAAFSALDSLPSTRLRCSKKNLLSLPFFARTLPAMLAG